MIVEIVLSARHLAPFSHRPSSGPSRWPIFLWPALIALLLRVVPTPSLSELFPAPLPLCVALLLRIPLSAVPVSKVPVRHADSPPSIHMRRPSEPARRSEPPAAPFLSLSTGLLFTRRTTGLLDVMRFHSERGGCRHFFSRHVWGPSGVRDNCICPGGVDTPMIAPAIEDEQILGFMHESTPLGRLARPA